MLQADLNNLIIGNTPLEFAFISGLTASMVGYLKRLGKDVPTLILSFQGLSSSGKSTCARLAVSTGTAPMPLNGKESLFLNANTTQNAMQAALDDNYGYPVAFDELGELGNDANMTTTLYSIANGQGKGRCDSLGNLLKKRTWCTTVIYTSEFPLLDLTNSADGILLRVISFTDVKWTLSAEQANEINEFCSRYHGLPIDQFSFELSELETEKVLALYERELGEMAAKVAIDPKFKERAAKAVAIFRLTAAIASKVFDVSFNVNGITDFVLMAVNRIQNKLGRLDLYDSFLQYVAENTCYFKEYIPTDNCEVLRESCDDADTYQHVDHPKTKVYGYIHYGYYARNRMKLKYIVILKDKFREWLKAHTDNSMVNKTLQEWYQRDLLVVSKKGRYTVNIPESDPFYSLLPVNDSGSPVSCYKIKANCPEKYVLYDVDYLEVGRKERKGKDLLKKKSPPAETILTEADGIFPDSECKNKNLYDEIDSDSGLLNLACAIPVIVDEDIDKPITMADITGEETTSEKILTEDDVSGSAPETKSDDKPLALPETGDNAEGGSDDDNLQHQP